MNTWTAEKQDDGARATAKDDLRHKGRGLNALPLAAAIVGSVYFVAHGLSVICGSERRVMEWLYDDCFYYLVTAKHLSEQHIPSFDGITLTSGYHPLWMWLCALLYSLHGRLDMTYVRSCMGLSLAITTVVLCAALRSAIVSRRDGMLWAIGLGTTSYSALNNGASAMEWSLVVLCWYLLHQVVMKGRNSRTGRDGVMALCGAFAIGFAGSLSRSDFGLIPVCYVAAAIVVHRRVCSYKALRAATATGGAIAGVAADFAYNHHMTGTWLQASAEVKHLFASVTTVFNPAPATWQFARVLLYLPPTAASHRSALMHLGLRALEIAAACLVVLAVPNWRRLKSLAAEWRERAPRSVAVIAAMAGVAGYFVVYGFDSQATYGWYTASVTGFVLILTAELLCRLRPARAAWIVFPLMVANAVAATVYGGNARGQMQEVATGKRMRAEHPNATMGGGDVGKPSFYNDGTLINLDGLMNNEVYPYLIDGRIQCYVLYRHIEYLSDIGSITLPLTDAERARHHEAPMPWTRYFVAVPADNTGGASNAYLKTDFDAIRASGECNRYNSEEEYPKGE